MRLLVLGRNSDDKGKQLEELAKQILTEMKYVELHFNVTNVAGEIDVEGKYITPRPGGDRIDELFCECKAHKDPLSTPDWLKFLGKLHIKKLQGRTVSGCLIALGGVNGNVRGSFNDLKPPEVTIVDSEQLKPLFSKSHHLIDQAQLHKMLRASIFPHYISIDLAYYASQVYWIVRFPNSKFTILLANGKFPEEETVNTLKPLLANELEETAFFDVRQEELAQRLAVVSIMLLISALITEVGDITIDTVLKKYAEYVNAEHVNHHLLQGALDRLKALNLVEVQGDAFKLSALVETDFEVRKNLFVEFLKSGRFSPPLGCEWWDAHIDEAFLQKIIELQCNIELTDEDKCYALIILKFSPSSLLYALQPDPMLTTDRNKMEESNRDVLRDFDRNQFMGSIIERCEFDFRTTGLAQYFLEHRQIESFLERRSVVFKKSDGEAVIDITVEKQTLLAKWGDVPDGQKAYVYVSAVSNFEETRRKAAEKQAEVPALAEAAAQPPDEPLDEERLAEPL